MDNPQAFVSTDPPTNIDIARSLERGPPVVVIDATTGRRWPVWAELDRSVDLNGNPPRRTRPRSSSTRRAISQRLIAISSRSAI
jgi:hypothetical protein